MKHIIVDVTSSLYENIFTVKKEKIEVLPERLSIVY